MYQGVFNIKVHSDLYTAQIFFFDLHVFKTHRNIDFTVSDIHSRGFLDKQRTLQNREVNAKRNVESIEKPWNSGHSTPEK